ncbi:MAG: carboxylesterase/lipase family protein [Gammaproteobacteria bacterium]
MKKAALILITLSFAVVLWFALTPAPEPPPAPPEPQQLTIRKTTSGEVVGFVAEGARTWLGIPYAEAPVGTLRWRAPVPPKPWTGLREAIAPGAMCPQKPSPLAAADASAPAFVGAEDCLYLNVYAPANASNLPVMFWIHGGGNTIGNGDDYVGARLATRHNLVIVTINYRLGPFGWFAHPALASGNPVDDSGNFGTLDIIRALTWTRDNVAAFGGDPGNVTVFGESAGAFNTLAMMASPLAEGLFHRAISQSGGFQPTPMHEAQAHASDGGHPYSARAIVNRLLVADGSAPDTAAAEARQEDMSANELRGYLYSKTPEDIFTLWSNSGFGMIDVPDNLGDGHVLPALDTATIFGDPARHHPVPVILGTNRDEPALFMAQDPRYVKRLLGLFPRLRDEAAYLRAVRYGALAWKARGVDELADAMQAAGPSRVFAYRFDFDELGSRAGYDLRTAIGAAHFLEVPFVFGDFVNFPLAYLFEGEHPARDSLSEQMMSYWAEFAYTGNPGRGRDGDLPQWAVWGSDGQHSIVFDTPADGGVRMTRERVTRDQVVDMLANDLDIADQTERCALYRSAFRFGGAFNADEYRTLGPGGCTDRPDASASSDAAGG